jgi:hypothetical protein
VIVQSDDVAGEGLLGLLRSAARKVSASAMRTSLSGAHDACACRARSARTQAHEGDAVAMPRIHVGLDLEHEAGELRLLDSTGALQRRARQRPGELLGTKADSSSLTPKLLTAEPKNTGVCFAAR